LKTKTFFGGRKLRKWILQFFDGLGFNLISSLFSGLLLQLKIHLWINKEEKALFFL
jgi:hypothetical protein